MHNKFIFYIFFILLSQVLQAKILVFDVSLSPPDSPVLSEENENKTDSSAGIKEESFPLLKELKSLILQSINDGFARIGYKNFSALKNIDLKELLNNSKESEQFKIPSNFMDFKILPLPNLESNFFKKIDEKIPSKEEKKYNTHFGDFVIYPYITDYFEDGGQIGFSFFIYVFNLKDGSLLFKNSAKLIEDMDGNTMPNIKVKLDQEFRFFSVILNQKINLYLGIISYKDKSNFVINQGKFNRISRGDEFYSVNADGKKTELFAYEVKDSVSLLSLQGGSENAALGDPIKKRSTVGLNLNFGADLMFLLFTSGDYVKYPFSTSFYMDIMFRKFAFSVKPFFGLSIPYFLPSESLFLKDTFLYFFHFGFYADFPLKSGFSLDFKTYLAPVFFSYKGLLYQDRSAFGVSHVVFYGAVGFYYLEKSYISLGAKLGYRHFFQVNSTFIEMGFISLEFSFSFRM